MVPWMNSPSASSYLRPAKSCRLSLSISSSSILAVRSHIGFGHHEGFMSSHIVTRLVFSGLSHEPYSKVTCTSNLGTEGSTTRSFRVIPNCSCSDVNIFNFRTLSTQKLRIIACSKSNYESLSSSFTNGLKAMPGTPGTYWSDFCYPNVAYSFVLQPLSSNSLVTANSLLDHLLTSSNLR